MSVFWTHVVFITMDDNVISFWKPKWEKVHLLVYMLFRSNCIVLICERHLDIVMQFNALVLFTFLGVFQECCCFHLNTIPSKTPCLYRKLSDADSDCFPTTCPLLLYIISVSISEKYAVDYYDVKNVLLIWFRRLPLYNIRKCQSQ